MTLVICILLILGVLALGIQVLAQLSVFWLVGRKRSEPLHHHWGVSVLKPLKGADLELERNLRSIFEQDWPRMELVVGSDDPHDPALAVVEKVARDYPALRCRIVTSALSLGLNPKVNLCAQLARHATYDLVIVSDASVAAPKHYVRSMVQAFGAPNTGLVASPLVGFGETSTGGVVDNLILNLFVLRAICFTKLFARHSCVIGKSMMFRLSDLRRLGGWPVVADVLAEDYVLGRLFRRAGFDVRLCPEVLPTRTHCAALGDGLNRHVRWCQMRRRTSSVAYLAELVANVSVWALALVVVALLAARTDFAIAGALLLGAKVVLDLVSISWLGPRQLSGQRVCWVLVADLLNFWVWVLGAVRRTVDWRGTRLLIGAQTRLTPLDAGQTSAAREAYYSAANF
ncbi:MAG TPA: glycosyltransferase [Polyangiaceae bacterium]|nr:glycosyltransferase [Polyangiaceae bacterium]